MPNSRPVFITPGEPAGVGPDITVRVAQQAWPNALVVIADPSLLQERAKELHLPLQVQEWNSQTTHLPGTLYVVPEPLNAAVKTGELNKTNADYVLRTLKLAVSLAQPKGALVTGPVHKEILNAAGFKFSGHTEFFAECCDIKQTIMLFVLDELKVALATTHIPLKDVSNSLSKDHLRTVLEILHDELQQKFGLHSPRIAICGLNPHAGEGGYLGREEIDIINPVIEELRQKQFNLKGPLPADTIFIPRHLQQVDVVLAMYHDQALPLIKYLGFDRAVNVTLGLPFIRTSVDHGTALDIAGTDKVNAGSMVAAIKLAIRMQNQH